MRTYPDPIAESKLILQKSKELQSLLMQKKDLDLIDTLVNKYQNEVDEYNNQNYDAIDATPYEIGFYNSTIRKTIMYKFFNHIRLKYGRWGNKKFQKDFDQSLEKLKLRHSLKAEVIYLKRRWGGWINKNELEKAAKEAQLLEIQQAYYNQFKKLIIKYSEK